MPERDKYRELSWEPTDLFNLVVNKNPDQKIFNCKR
jgi:hypothetical protein